MALNLFLDKEGFTTKFLNISRWIKVTFLSFAQAVFNEYDVFKWEPNRKITKIIIQDKFADSNINPELIPHIVLTRGPIRFSRMTTSTLLEGDTLVKPTKDKEGGLARTAISFSCIANDQATSEHIADLLWAAIISNTTLLKAKGVHYINSVDVSESSPIKSEDTTSKIELFSTTVDVVCDLSVTYWSHANEIYNNSDMIEKYDLTISGYPDEADLTLVLKDVQ